MNPIRKGYEFFEHTADIGLRASGSTLPDLFTHAAQGLVELLAEDSLIAWKDTRSVRLKADSVDRLLHAWLTEVIFWFDSDRFLPGIYCLEVIGERELIGQVKGERFDTRRHISGVEVKGITRHAFSVTRANELWDASLILDV